MITPLVVAVALMTPTASPGARAQAVHPFERNATIATANPIDARVLASLQRHAITPAYLCSDAVFLRRVYVDVIGTMPEPQEVRRFLKDRRPNKRALLIDALLRRDEFADYWSLKWCDLLRVKAEFPINLWPNAVQAYHRWIRDAVRENRPYDRFARDLLTSSGSNFRVPAVNFYRAIQGKKPGTIADAVALTFMGVRTANWSEIQRTRMAVFFSRVAFKGTAEWKEEIVCLDPKPLGSLDAILPDGIAARIKPNEDPRRVFTDWLLAPDNPWFARNITNRVWSWLLGRGIVHEPDDIRPDNPPANPELLAYLERELVKHKYDLRHLFRIILNSGVYQQSPIPRSTHPKAEALFAHYRVRRIDAEVLIDALCRIGGPGEGYSSAIPEPFSFIPAEQRTIALADGSITSQFLEMFGRPARDTGLESERSNKPTAAQRLHLLNSTHIQSKIVRSRRLRRLIRLSGSKPEAVIRALYVAMLSRQPTSAELVAAEKYWKTSRLGKQKAAEDLVWALVNSKEFLYRH
jgi:uncharacterized protein DUF1553/uncharacterized protein DUF1549